MELLLVITIPVAFFTLGLLLGYFAATPRGPKSPVPEGCRDGQR